jgi:hypothetical protein
MKVLYKAQVFIDEYVKSLHKHHAQCWTSPSLLFLGAFGEFETGQIVARLLLGKAIIFYGNDDANNNKQFKPALHEGMIDLELFATWLKEILIGSVVEEAVSSPNVEEVMEAIEAITDGINIWDEKNLVGQIYREECLENFAAIPSTMEMVERSVKKAKFCQQTGKGERSVSAYGITGNGVSERCRSQFVVSAYEEEMVRRQSRRRRVEISSRRCCQFGRPSRQRPSAHHARPCANSSVHTAYFTTTCVNRQ